MVLKKIFYMVFYFISTLKKILLIFLVLLYPNLKAQENSKTIIDKMFVAIDKIETLKFTLKKAERINGEMKYGEQDVKFNRLKKQIYTYIQKPNKGVELLWIAGKNNGHAYINPNGFPFINVKLDPYGSNMRKGNHHTVYEVGFDYISKIISFMRRKTMEDIDNIFLYQGIIKFDNKDCYKVIVDYTPFKYIKYTVLKGESVTDIAYKFFISDYMILKKNKEIKNFGDVKPGQIIIIPNAYARKTVLYIDKNTYLPILQTMYDDIGLFEQYEFYNLQLNPKIAEEEFTKEYKGYHF